MAGDKLPAIMFYGGDWLRDPIAGCTLAAQGLWLRLLIVAFDADRCGYMFAYDSPQAKASVARRCGCGIDEFDALMAELFAAGVPGIQDGFVISRRMVRDAKLREIRAKAGRKGGKQTAKQNRSKSAASSQAKPQQNTESENEYVNDFESESKETKEDAFEQFWKVFPSRRKKSKGKARAAFAKATAKKPAGEIIAAADEYAASDEGRGEYAKMPETWLNAECWDDDRAAWRQPSIASSKNPLDPLGNFATANRYLEGLGINVDE